MSVFTVFGERYEQPSGTFPVPGLSQYQVAELIGVSRQRVFELEHRALRKIRAAIEAEAAAAGVSPLEWLTGNERGNDA